MEQYLDSVLIALRWTEDILEPLILVINDQKIDLLEIEDLIRLAHRHFSLDDEGGYRKAIDAALTQKVYGPAIAALDLSLFKQEVATFATHGLFKKRIDLVENNCFVRANYPTNYLEAKVYCVYDIKDFKKGRGDVQEKTYTMRVPGKTVEDAIDLLEEHLESMGQNRPRRFFHRKLGLGYVVDTIITLSKTRTNGSVYAADMPAAQQMTATVPPSNTTPDPPPIWPGSPREVRKEMFKEIWGR